MWKIWKVVGDILRFRLDNTIYRLADTKAKFDTRTHPTPSIEHPKAEGFIVCSKHLFNHFCAFIFLTMYLYSKHHSFKAQKMSP